MNAYNMADKQKLTTVTDEKRYPGYTDDAHPELFDLRAMLPQPRELKPGQLPEEKIRQYFEDVRFY